MVGIGETTDELLKSSATWLPAKSISLPSANTCDRQKITCP